MRPTIALSVLATFQLLVALAGALGVAFVVAIVTWEYRRGYWVEYPNFLSDLSLFAGIGIISLLLGLTSIGLFRWKRWAHWAATWFHRAVLILCASILVIGTLFERSRDNLIGGMFNPLFGYGALLTCLLASGAAAKCLRRSEVMAHCTRGNVGPIARWSLAILLLVAIGLTLPIIVRLVFFNS